MIAAAEATRRPSSAGACEPAAIAANVGTVEERKIVRVGGLVADEHSRDGACVRAGKLANIVGAAVRAARPLGGVSAGPGSTG